MARVGGVEATTTTTRLLLRIGLIQGCNFLNSEKEETSDAELYK